jgi:hypothetical protein
MRCPGQEHPLLFGVATRISTETDARSTVHWEWRHRSHREREHSLLHTQTPAQLSLRSVAVSQLPKLSWVAEVDRLTGLVSLQHGSNVEIRQNFFVEGVWNGRFEDGGFGTTDCFFGTGGIVNERSIRFVSSASTTDYLYYHDTPRRVAASNSLPLLLAFVGDSLDPHFRGYPAIHDSITEGIADYLRDIPTRNGMVRRLMYRNLDVSNEGLFESEKIMPPSFVCFDDYFLYLRDNYSLIAANARDDSRTTPLEIFSTQSKGYDTTAVNTIARDYCIDKVFTVTKAKSIFHLAHNDEGKQPDDDGGEVCKALGLSCIPIDRRSFSKEFEQEYLYYCVLHYSQDANLKEISAYVSRVSLLLTGTLGEIWYTKDCLNSSIDSDLRRGDLGGHGMAELRLVAGFIHVPLPYIGARRRQDIQSITESAEMAPWRLGNAYDRPIPRRIAEEAGVPREKFGQVKMGSVVLFPRPSIPYGKALRVEFFDHLVSEHLMTRFTTRLWPAVHFVNSILMLKSEARFRAVYYFERAVSKLLGRRFSIGLLWSRLDGSLFCYCVNRTAETYSKHLNRLPSALG